jgi:L-ascorbate metabolism protein UlaG (beta-lactamase superfamily)
MKITKIGHCCLIIKEENVTMLTDPGSFTSGQDEVLGINIILITHEHTDHVHVDSLKRILKNNPEAKIITNTSVGKILDKENIPYEIIDDGKEKNIGSVLIQGKGMTHATIHPSLPTVENTGYFINKKLFYPGDALHDPGQPIDILALPIVGPWTKTSEVVDYALKLKPKKAFPVHDGMLNQHGMFYTKMIERFLPNAGIEFVVLELNTEYEL